jgi:hypothetical protein
MKVYYAACLTFFFAPAVMLSVDDLERLSPISEEASSTVTSSSMMLVYWLK